METCAHGVSTTADILASRTEPFVTVDPLLGREERDATRYIMMSAVAQQAVLRSSLAAGDIFSAGEDGRVGLRATAIASAQQGDLGHIAENGAITIFAKGAQQLTQAGPHAVLGLPFIAEIFAS